MQRHTAYVRVVSAGQWLSICIGRTPSMPPLYGSWYTLPSRHEQEYLQAVTVGRWARDRFIDCFFECGAPRFYVCVSVSLIHGNECLCERDPKVCASWLTSSTLSSWAHPPRIVARADRFFFIDFLTLAIVWTTQWTILTVLKMQICKYWWTHGSG